MPNQIQKGGETAYDRYPNVFYVARRYIESKKRDATILSFGCSTGEEVFCLAERYFPSATIVGVDVDENRLAVANQKNTFGNRVLFDFSNSVSVKAHGPYDVIFAMSVLCRWPESGEIDDISPLYEFDTFELQVKLLDENLKPGGLLIVCNSNFSFLDCSISSNYDVVLSKHVRSNGFIKRFNRANQSVGNLLSWDCIYAKRESGTSEPPVGIRQFLNEDGLLIGRLCIGHPGP